MSSMNDNRVPKSRYGAPRRVSMPRSPWDAVDVHLRLPAWLAGPLYATARTRRATVSSVVVLAMAPYLGVDEPAEDGDGPM